MKKSFLDKVREKAGIAPTKKRALQNKKDAQHKMVQKRLSDAKEVKGKKMLETLSSVTRNTPKKKHTVKGYELQNTSNPQSQAGGRLFIQGTNKLKSKLKK